MTASNEPRSDAEKRGKLSETELSEFLGGGLTAHLSCTDDKGWPYVVPIWFEWDNSAFWIVAHAKAMWLNYIDADPRVALSVDDVRPTRRVLCQGKATIVEGPAVNRKWMRIGERMANRYLGDEGPAHFDSIRNKSFCLVKIDPVKLVSWQGPSRHD